MPSGTRPEDTLTAALGKSAIDRELGQFAAQATSGEINQIANGLATGGKINCAQIAADGCGNPIANAIETLISPPQDTLHTIQVTAKKISANSITATGTSPGTADAFQTKNPELSSTVQLQPISVDLFPLPPSPITVTAQPGDSISTLLGTSNPVAIEAFMRANDMSGTDSAIYAGQSYVLPGASDYTAAQADRGQQGQATLNADNARQMAELQPVTVTAQLATLSAGAALSASAGANSAHLQTGSFNAFLPSGTLSFSKSLAPINGITEEPNRSSSTLLLSGSVNLFSRTQQTTIPLVNESQFSPGTNFLNLQNTNSYNAQATLNSEGLSIGAGASTNTEFALAHESFTGQLGNAGVTVGSNINAGANVQL